MQRGTSRREPARRIVSWVHGLGCRSSRHGGHSGRGHRAAAGWNRSRSATGSGSNRAPSDGQRRARDAPSRILEILRTSGRGPLHRLRPGTRTTLRTQTLEIEPLSASAGTLRSRARELGSTPPPQRRPRGTYGTTRIEIAFDALNVSPEQLAAPSGSRYRYWKLRVEPTKPARPCSESESS